MLRALFRLLRNSPAQISTTTEIATCATTSAPLSFRRHLPCDCPAASPLMTATRSGREAHHAGAKPKITPVNNETPSVHFNKYKSGLMSKSIGYTDSGKEA